MNNLYIRLHMFTISIVIIVSLLYSLKNIYVLPKWLDSILMIFALISSLYLLFQRDVYLPFLGHSVLPESLLLDSKLPVDPDTDVTIYGKPNTKVLYWAADPSDKSTSKIKSPKEAYNAYENSGVVFTDDDGKAILKVKCPQTYKVKEWKILPKHVHYRFIKDGMISSIYTVKLNC